MNNGITRPVGNEIAHNPYLQRAAWCGNSRGIHLMGNLTVAVLGKLGYCSALGKKGTSTDITLYNLKKGEDTVTLIEPTRYPERLAPLFYACSANASLGFRLGVFAGIGTVGFLGVVDFARSLSMCILVFTFS